MGIKVIFEFHIHIIKGDKDIRQDDKKERKCEHQSTKTSDFLKRAQKMVCRLEKTMSHSTIDNYQTALRSFSQYVGESTKVKEFDLYLVKGFERWLRDKQLSMNTISCYMRSLRSLCSKMENKKLLETFNTVYTGRMTTEKRAVPESVISQVKAVKLKKNSFMSLTRDLFLFSFYARGMPFIDMAFLRKSQINDGMLIYDRHKTGKRVTVHLEPCMLGIISHYHKDNSTYVFPLLKSENPQKAYDEYLYKLNQYNHSLKRLAKIAGVKDRLTSYTPRHTWASVAYDSNVDLPVISKALGHSNTQTTLTYIKEINDSRLDDANRMIVSKIEAME